MEGEEGMQTPMTLFISGLLALIGFVGNIIVLRVYSKKAQKSSTDTLIIVLAANDLIACITVIPFDIKLWLQPDMQTLELQCPIYFFLFHGTYFTTLLMLVSIAIERWLLICKSIDVNGQIIAIKKAVLWVLPEFTSSNLTSKSNQPISIRHHELAYLINPACGDFIWWKNSSDSFQFSMNFQRGINIIWGT